jgi:hypothetical protein
MGIVSIRSNARQGNEVHQECDECNTKTPEPPVATTTTTPGPVTDEQDDVLALIRWEGEGGSGLLDE